MALSVLRALSISAAIIGGAAVTLPAFAPQAYAAASEAEQQEALAFFTEVSDEAFAVLRNESLSKDEQKVEFRRLFKKVTAVEQIGPLLLGFHRKKFSEDQLSDYTEMLPDYVVALYTDRLIEVGDEEVTIQKTYTQGSKDVWIVTRVTSPFGGDDLRADWRIRRLKDGSFSLLDVKVENISLFQTKKDEFMSFLSDRGVDAFLERLRADAAKSAA
jgi:phospholipid transport system substrate-binding protein